MRNFKRFKEDKSNKNFVVDIEYVHGYITEDTYEEGEVGRSRNWDLDIKGKGFTDIDEIFNFLKDEIYFSEDEYFQKKFWDLEDSRLMTDWLVEEDNSGYLSTPSEEDIEKWKKGKKKLFNVSLIVGLKKRYLELDDSVCREDIEM